MLVYTIHKILLLCCSFLSEIHARSKVAYFTHFITKEKHYHSPFSLSITSFDTSLGYPLPSRIWGCIFYLLTWNLVTACTLTFLNTPRETVSVRYNCCTTLAVSDPVLNQRSVRPRCSVSDMSDTIVSFNALPNFSLISVRRSLNTAASAWQIFLLSVIPDPHSLHFILYRTVLSWFHCMYDPVAKAQ